MFSIPHILLIISFVTGNLLAEDIFTERLRWQPVKFDFSALTPKQHEQIINNTKIPSNLPYLITGVLGIGFWKDQLYLTTMDDQLYVKELNQSVVLARVDLSNLNPDNKSPLIQPFAVDDLMNQVKTISTLVIDECNRLWFVDFGQMRLYAVSLEDGKKLRDVHLNTTAGSFFSTISVDVLANPETGKHDCDNTYVYVPHPNRSQFVVYHFKEDTQWLIQNPSFTFSSTINSTVVDIFNNTTNRFILATRGIRGTALGQGNGNKILYFTCDFMPFMFSVSTKTLQNPSPSTPPVFHVVGVLAEKDTLMINPGLLIHYDEQTGILFYNIVRENKLRCWNTKRFPNAVSNDTTDELQLSGVTIEHATAMTGDEHSNVWISQMHLDSEDNGKSPFVFHLSSAPVANVIKNTKCQPL